MRRIPRSGRFVVAQTLTVVVAEHRRTGCAAGPIVAGHVFGARKRTTVRLGAGEDVVHVGFVTAGVDSIAFFGESGLLVDLVVIAVQVVDIFGDNHPFSILPRAFADAIAGIHSRFAIDSICA